MEVGGGLGYDEGKRVPVSVTEVGLGGWRWCCQISGEGEEVLKVEREGVFESWEEGLVEVSGGVREIIEEERLAWREEKPRYVKESERKRCWRN